MLFEDPPDFVRFCGWCDQAFPPTREFFARNDHGRYNLQSVCRSCSNYDRSVRKKLERRNPRPETCEVCLAAPATCINHCHQTNQFKNWTCQSCNLKDRVPYIIGRG